MGTEEAVESSGARAGQTQGPDKEAVKRQVDGISPWPCLGRYVCGTHTVNALRKKSHKSYFRWSVSVQESGMRAKRKEAERSAGS